MWNVKFLKRLTRGLRPTRSPLFSLFHIIETADLESQPPNWNSLFSQTLNGKLCQMEDFLSQTLSVKKPQLGQIWTLASRIGERVQSYFVLAECFLSLPPTVGHHACLKVKANPIPRSQKSKWSFIFYLASTNQAWFVFWCGLTIQSHSTFTEIRSNFRN